MPDVIKGKYQIVREIARSNDIVYEAIDTTFGRKIALKELNISAGVSGQARRERIERFNREARAAGRLSHPNIVSVFDYGEENGRYFIAMEFLEGQSLRDAMQVRGAYGLQEALQIFYQVLDALAYAHANRVIHRDIKPDNIHILPGGQAKITDFGIARLGEEPALTGDGQVFGTPSYMSPEQIEGKSIDFHSDLFSGGILLYEMLAGRKPFVGDSVISITYAIMHAEPPPINGVPQGVEQVIRRALSKMPAMRQASAEQMKMDLKNAEQTPAMFLPPGNTAMGANRTGLGFGYNGTGTPLGGAGYGYPPQNTGYTVGPGQAMPGYSPPAHSGGAPLPWNWNTPGQPQQQQPVYNVPQTYAGPAQTPPGTGLPYPYASPPFPAVRPAPVFTLSPASRTALTAAGIAIALGSGIAALIIATQNSYDRWNETTREEAVNALMRVGKQAYDKNDYVAAIASFEKAANSGPGADQKQIISTDLAYSYVKQGRLDRVSGRLTQAKADYLKAIDALPDFATAHSELSEVLQQMGDAAGAQDQRSAASDTTSTGGAQSPPSTLSLSAPPHSPAENQDPNSYIADQRQAARRLLDEGDRLEAGGDMDGAREKWKEAASVAPGTPESTKANDKLYPNGSAGGE